MAMSLEQLFESIGYVTLKMTPGCNLKCSYCNVEALTPKTPKMEMGQYRRIADLLIDNSKAHFIGLEFHGGEPLLLPDDWYEEAITYARTKAKARNKVIEFPLVTNGTMLSEKRLDRLNGLGIRFCLSCDGPPAINDELRGAGERVERALRLLREKRVPKGVITVLSPSNWHRMGEVMTWFGEIGVNDFTINFMQPQGRGMESTLLSGKQMFEAMRDIFEHMYENDLAVTEAETLLRVTRFAAGRENPAPLHCSEFGCQAGKTYVAVDHHGVLHACGTDLANHPIGHVDKPFDEAHYNDTLARLHDKGSWVVRCFDCNAKQICNHSCPTSDYNSDDFKEYDCESTKLLWEYFCKNATRVNELADRYMSRRMQLRRRQIEVEEQVPA
ncbi:MAG: radical SAM protein [Hyphomicrobiales bacterium]|nr:radical SAM protein [Hyphomicrobiales bacterium]